MSKILLLCSALALGLQAQPTAPTVTATPATLSFTYQAGAALPTAQTVSLKAGSSTPTFTTAITGNNTLWLTVGPDAGKLPASLSVRVNPTSLAVGTYTANIAVTVTGVATPVTIPVTLIVTSPPSTLTLSATTLNFAAPPNPPATQTVNLSTNGAPISFAASSGVAWLQVTPAVGVVLPGEQTALTVSVDPSSLAPQTAPYTAKVTVVASGAAVTAKSQTITVNLTVNSVQPTIASIWPATLPLNGASQTITIRGTNFYNATTVKVQTVTAPLTTTVLSSSALLAIVPATLITTPGTLNVIVSNPAPGGDSTASPVTVTNAPAILGILNSASYGNILSPGQLASIFGTNIGPTTPASMTITNGFVDTTLSGVTVTVDGQAAPLIYVSQNQITMQVPYEATSGAGKQVVVTNGTSTPANAAVTIAGNAPGIFTADGSGTGQAAALNYNATTQQYTLNSGSNTAKIGDTVVLYLTGEGDYATALPGPTHTGYIIPSTLNPLPQMNPLPAVTIGGANATVSYAGPVVGSIIGILQVNVVVPTGSTTGTAVPVMVTMSIGGNTTQAGITLAIHP